MKKLLLALCLVFALATASGMTSFAPENDEWIPATTYKKSAKTITEDQFNMINQNLTSIYSPVFNEQGGNFVLVEDWEDGTVNAYTQRLENNWQINMFGGLARYPQMTADGYAMVVCHEIGHQIGGLPVKTWYGRPSWAAAEGQADYFAAKCLRELLRYEDNVEKIKYLDVPKIAVEQCNMAWKDANDSATCQRVAVAGEVLGTVLSRLGGGPATDLDTPSKVVVSKTNIEGYPGAQCRSDSYLAGALCYVDSSINPNGVDIHDGYCSREEGDTLGVRPVCWYKPE